MMNPGWHKMNIDSYKIATTFERLESQKFVVLHVNTLEETPV